MRQVLSKFLNIYQYGKETRASYNFYRNLKTLNTNQQKLLIDNNNEMCSVNKLAHFKIL